jgi:hypothetical protein
MYEIKAPEPEEMRANERIVEPYPLSTDETRWACVKRSKGVRVCF